ncbi:MAG: peptidoglycan D,D-transpeptidase FtsI family protein [Anaerovoracaceae bacterium]|jgi:stage V sporulation protein D (sporulation-specific penicillin-binding protein)
MARMTPVSITNKKRLVIAFTIFCLLLVVLCIRVGYVQVVKGDVYKKKAIAQQTKDEVVEAKRGGIVDRNGEELAVSTIKYSVWVRPAAAADKAEKEKVISRLAQILGMPQDEVGKKLSGKTALVKLAKYRSLSTADKIRKAGLPGVTITEETKRYYPLGDFASQLLGSVTDDNNGLAGVEQYYNRQLKGVAGRWIENTDVKGNSLTYGNDKHYGAQDGDNIQLTIDEVIQNYAEESIVSTMKSTKAKRVSCLVMNPKTGEILAMASTPGYDPNNSRKPLAKDKAAFDKMSSKKQLEYLNKMWRNPLVSDSYEPGSTFKLLTTAMALEENKVNQTETFECGGGLNVNGTFIKCWIYPGSHGTQDLKHAVGNSCNPVFMRLAQRVGKDRFYDYLDLFGITEKTGIDYPGEASAQIQNKKNVGLVELSTMGFGQGIAVTPIQLLTTINSFGNNGLMMQPHLVKAIKNSSGKTIKTIKPKVVRKTVSHNTSKRIKEYMEFVVKEGGGTKAQIKGYRVGGKTGTAQKKSANSNKYDKLIASFVGMAPINDPRLSILYIVDEPEGEVWGSDVAAPGAQKVLKKTLRYMKIKESD